jgi:hypothetical protein
MRSTLALSGLEGILAGPSERSFFSFLDIVFPRVGLLSRYRFRLSSSNSCAASVLCDFQSATPLNTRKSSSGMTSKIRGNRTRTTCPRGRGTLSTSGELRSYPLWASSMVCHCHSSGCSSERVASVLTVRYWARLQISCAPATNSLSSVRNLLFRLGSIDGPRA